MSPEEVNVMVFGWSLFVIILSLNMLAVVTTWQRGMRVSALFFLFVIPVFTVCALNQIGVRLLGDV